MLSATFSRPSERCAVAEVLFMKSGSEESDRGARAAGHSLLSPGEEVTAITRK